jgi:hypothetical protein
MLHNEILDPLRSRSLLAIETSRVFGVKRKIETSMLRWMYIRLAFI